MLKKPKLSINIEGIRGLSFHASLPWILAGGQSGTVYLYDYFVNSLIATFLAHEKSTRAVCFHPTQPLFATGSDDTKLKLWHFSNRRCLYTFSQHTGCLQTIEFHRTLPWILTACSDKLLRIFNWQNRACLFTISGHKDVVISAAFHPEDDLILSGSKDETVRLWDYSDLKKKYSTSTGIKDEAIVHEKVIMEKTPVTWATFHPKKQLIASCHEDGVVRVWRYQDTQGWELQTLNGHVHKAVCCLFLSKQDVLLSCSDDHTVVVWNYKDAKIIHREYEEGKIWSLAVHKNGNYIGEGHEGGFKIFKIEREQPPFERISTNIVCRIYNEELQLYDLLINQANSIKKLSNDNINQKELFTQYKFYINPFDNSGKVFLIMKKKTVPPYDVQYEVYVFPNSMISKDNELQSQGKGTAVFVGRDNICVLLEDELKLVTYNGTIKRKFEWPNSAMIYPATLGKVLISSSLIELYDVTAKKVIAKFRSSFTQLKKVIWSKQFTVVAFIFKNGIAVCGKELTVFYTLPLKETVLTAHFDNNGAIIYSTHQHIKYLLPDGSLGIIVGTEHPIYPICITDSTLYYIKRAGTFGTRKICMDEYNYRLSVLRGRLENAQRILEAGDMWGSNTIRYLDTKGFPELALKYERSQRGKFSLAISSGQLDIALNAAMVIKEKDYFEELGNQAMRLGNAEIAEVCFQRILGFEQLAFLYLVTGNSFKLRKLMILTKDKLKNPMLSYQIAVMLGDVEEMVKILSEAGYYFLAQKLANVHRIKDMENRLQERTKQEITDNATHRLVFPMKQITQFIKSWPIKIESTIPKEEEKKDVTELIKEDKTLDNIINGTVLKTSR